jgi:hypothetical protein
MALGEQPQHAAFGLVEPGKVEHPVASEQITVIQNARHFSNMR